MARLGISQITAFSEDRVDQITVKFTIHVNSEGLFTTTLDPKDAEFIKSYGIALKSNRTGKPGYFQSSTKDSLLEQIKETLDICLSREEISSGVVIKYAIKSTASFGFTVDDKVIPNLGWTEDGEPDLNRHWQNGTYVTHAANRAPVGIQLYVRPYLKKEFRYKNNEVRIEYHGTNAFGHSNFDKKNYYLHWLEQICSTRPPSRVSLHEIPYTEQNAKFFVEMFKSICLMANKIAQFENPENMLELIENGDKLLT